MITQKSKREISESAMRQLLGLAQNIKSSGTGELPLDVMSEAKQYFPDWKKMKIINPNFKIIVFVIFAGIIILFKNIDIKAFAMITAFYFGMIWYYNHSTLKYNYVSEMIGDWSHLDFDEREFYKIGLLKSLWKTKKDYSYQFSGKKYIVMVSIAALAIIPLFFFDPHLMIFKDFDLEKISKILIVTIAFFAAVMKFKDEPFA